MKSRLEHVNLVVRNLDETLAFLQTAFPDWSIRHQSRNDQGQRWLHFGDQQNYLAVSQATARPAEAWRPYQGRPGINHLGFEVNDVTVTRNRLVAAGYRESTVANHHPYRQRVYFNDPDGNDWEFVEYFSDRGTDRNDYQLSENDSPRVTTGPVYAPADSIIFL